MINNDGSVRKILILAANPKGTDKLRLDEEARDIKEGLRQARERDRFIIDSEWAVRPRDVRRTILYSKPQIVHFSGHGAEDGGLAFENEIGQVQLVQPDALAGLFKLLAEYVECVVLNACYSEIQANAIAQHIDFVIGMSKEIGDRAAIEFAVGFYDALGAGCLVETAYEFGCNAIQMAGIPEHLTPVLKCKSNFPATHDMPVSQELNSAKSSMTRSLKLEASPKTVYEFVLTGSVDEVSKQRLEAIVTHLREITGDTSLTLLKIESGSIKLVLEGSGEGFRRLESLFASGELGQVLGIPVQRVRRRELKGSSLERNFVPITRNQYWSDIDEVAAIDEVTAEIEIGSGHRRVLLQLDQQMIDVGFTHEDFAALLDKYDYHFSPGDVVAGSVFSLEPRGALIDIGAKTAAYIPIQEMSINRVENPDEILQPNEIREFFILADENDDGQLTLSIRRIEYMRAWERVRQLHAEDATVRSVVFAVNRGGALVRIEGLRGFIPGSHISTRKPKEELVGEELPLKFLEVDEERNRLVLSHRRALVERKMNRLEIGDVVTGIIRGIKPYGAFVDIGGVSGLLHISEVSHNHIDTLEGVLSANDEIKVMIIDLDAERGRISLSTKQLEPEPGDMVSNPHIVYERAEEMAAKYCEKLQIQAQISADEVADQANTALDPNEQE
ncbi:MAG: S1 RNA-binding domain-containing protein [Stenomitos frigidus ULC029]